MAIGVSLPAAALVKASAFPVVAVGDAAVDLAPAWLKEWAIRSFGENDKAILLTGVLAVLAAVAAATGVLAVRRLRYGLACLAAFGAVGLLAVLTRPGAGPGDAVPTLLGVAAGMFALSRLLRRALVPVPPPPPVRFLAAHREAGPRPEPGTAPQAEAGPQTADRRGTPARRSCARGRICAPSTGGDC
ncbi:hypothetical protein [Planomonospora algeriensis]